MPSSETELFGLIAFIGFLALALHSLWQMSKKREPATSRLPSGVDGLLLAAASLGFVGGIYDAAASGLAFGAGRAQRALPTGSQRSRSSGRPAASSSGGVRE